MATNDAPPLTATLYVEYEDGTVSYRQAARHGRCRSTFRQLAADRLDDLAEERSRGALTPGPEVEPLGHPGFLIR